MKKPEKIFRKGLLELLIENIEINEEHHSLLNQIFNDEKNIEADELIAKIIEND